MFVGVVRGTHQRPGLAVGEAELERVALVVGELVRVHPAVDRKVLGGGLEVLAEGDHLDAGGAITKGNGSTLSR
jgi:hypothetical protein